MGTGEAGTNTHTPGDDTSRLPPAPDPASFSPGSWLANDAFHSNLGFADTGNSPPTVRVRLRDAAVAAAERRMARRGLRVPGLLFALYLGLYGVKRFFLEFLRATALPILLGLTWAQLVALAYLAAAVAGGLAGILRARPRAPLTTARGSRSAPGRRGGGLDGGSGVC